jgi:hypothetical protein
VATASTDGGAASTGRGRRSGCGCGCGWRWGAGSLRIGGGAATGSIGREGLQLRLGAPKTLGIPAAMGLEPPLQQLALNILAEGWRERLLKQPIEIGQ